MIDHVRARVVAAAIRRHKAWAALQAASPNPETSVDLALSNESDAANAELDAAVERLLSMTETAEVTSQQSRVCEGRERAWLVELPGNQPVWLEWTQWPRRWVVDSSKALRFARQEDANRVAREIGDPAIATEHMWIAVQPPSQPSKKETR